MNQNHKTQIYNKLILQKVQKCTMWTSVKNPGTKVLTNSTSLLSKRNMSLVVVRKPPLFGDTEESYKNNPICTVNKYDNNHVKKNPVRHPEIVQHCCSFPGCENKICCTLCAKPLEQEAKAIAHVTHGNPEGAIPFNSHDLSDNAIPENILIYKNPHPVTDINSTLQEQKTENLQDVVRRQHLEEILKKHQDHHDE